MGKKRGMGDVLKGIFAGARKRQGLTQQQAGRLLGHTQNTLSYKESHLLGVKLAEIILMAEAYGLDVYIGGEKLTGGGQK